MPLGFLNGVLGASPGSPEFWVTILVRLRGWPKGRADARFQPVAVAIFLMSAGVDRRKGASTPETIKLFAIGLPALLPAHGSA